MIEQLFGGTRTLPRLSIATEGGEVGREGNKLDYLPFGVKTLKLVAEGDYKGKLRLSPKRLSPVHGEKFGHEDGGEPPQFVISWGGGQEDYYLLDYPKSRVAHFFVHHVVGDPDHLGSGRDHLLTIEVRSDKDGEVVDRVPVSLTYPRTGGKPWPSEQLVRPSWQEVASGLRGSCDISLLGTYAPHYVSRWWPQNRVEYAYGKKPPVVRLHYRRLVEHNSGDLMVYASWPEEKQVLLAEIGGSIGYPLYDMRQVVPELYRFGPAWVLRVWFFWLDLQISREDLSKCWDRDEGELEEAWKLITKKADGGLAERGWREDHEIPDAERVDIVFGDDLQPLYGATDLHWRELWGESSGDPVKVQIMNTKPLGLLTSWEQLGKAIGGWASIIKSKVNNRPPYKPHELVRAQLDEGKPLGADPFRMESHSPVFLNIDHQAQLTSTDVTEA